VINSQDIVFNDIGFFKDPYFNFSMWTPSYKLDQKDSNFQAISIPFKFPAEAALSPELNRLNHQPLGIRNAAEIPVAIFSLNQFSIADYVYGSTNIKAVTYEENQFSQGSYTRKDLYTRMPALWQNNSSPFVNTKPGAVFMVLKKNMGLNFDLSIRLIGNQSGHVAAESLGTGLKFSYRLANNVFKHFENSGFNVFLGLSGLQRLDDRTLAFLRQESTTQNGKGRSMFFNPGFSFTTRNMILEGTVQLPVYQHTSIGDLDTLWKYEYQGRLGMKWYLPEFIKP